MTLTTQQVESHKRLAESFRAAGAKQLGNWFDDAP